MSESFVSLNKKQDSIKKTHRLPPPPPPRTTSGSLQQPSTQQQQQNFANQPSQQRASQARLPPVKQNSQTSINSQKKVSLPPAMSSTNNSLGRDVVCAENEEIAIKYLMAERNYDNLKKVARKGQRLS